MLESTNTIRLLLWLWLAAAAGWLAFDYVKFVDWREQTESTAKQRAQEQAQEAVDEIERTLEMVERAARQMARELSSGETAPAEVEQRIKQISRENPRIFGLGVAFTPQAVRDHYPALAERSNPPKRELCTDRKLADFLYAPYFRRTDDDSANRKLVYVNHTYDYTCRPKYWYTCPLGLYPQECPRPSGEMWLEPYFGEASQRMVEEYGVPFYRPGGKERGEAPVGVVWANMTLEEISDFLASLDIGSMGYGFLLSPKGKFIAHPRESVTKRSVTIGEVARQLGRPMLVERFHAAKAGTTQLGDTTDPLSGESAWWIMQHVPRADWVLGIVVLKDELMGRSRDDRRQGQIRLALSAVAALLPALLLAISFLVRDEERSLWWGALTISATLLVLIGIIWSLAIRYPHFAGTAPSEIRPRAGTPEEERPGGDRAPKETDAKVGIAGLPGQAYWAPKILSQGQLRRFEKHYLEYRSGAATRQLENLVFLPTGLFVQSIQFAGSNAVQVSGYVWQRLPPTDPGCPPPKGEKATDTGVRIRGSAGVCTEVNAGVQFPEATDTSVTEAYRKRRNDGGLTIGWNFNITLRETFSYDNYPFDVQNVWIRLWNPQLDNNLALVPDLHAYPVLSPKTLPGLGEDFVLPDWNLEGTFFGYRGHNYSTDFGIKRFSGEEDTPELYFNILVKRRFLGPFISSVMPVIVVAAILFALLLTTTRREENTIFGFNTSAVLASCAGLFFGVLIGHTELRSALHASGLVYIESFYLILYAALLLVSVNTYVFSVNGQNGLLNWRDNLLPKLCYWPSLLLSLLWVTLVTFF